MHKYLILRGYRPTRDAQQALPTHTRISKLYLMKFNNHVSLTPGLELCACLSQMLHCIIVTRLIASRHPLMLKLGNGRSTCLLLAVCTTFVTLAANVEGEPSAPGVEIETRSGESDYKTLEWTDLIPEDDLEALLTPPDYIDEIEDGSADDQIGDELQGETTSESDDRYQQALVSTRVIESMDGKSIRIPGFVVPLTFNENQDVTEFFLVPYFGACLHMPPPPPNQIILVKAATGMNVEELYTPFWISGVLSTAIVENDIATAAYTMAMRFYEVYE